MKTLNLVQGSPEWHAHRAEHRNASEASIMLGDFPGVTRSELLKVRATGIERDITAFLQKIFDDGHRFEALARPLAEQIVGEDLYPCVGADGLYSASFDGLTLIEDTAFEHKMLNSVLREMMVDGCTGADLPIYHQEQMEQQCMVSGAARVLFMASDWDDDGNLIEERHCWYTPDPALRARIVAGWAQFEADLATYEVPQFTPAPIGHAPPSLPALRIELTGLVTASNLGEFRDAAIAKFRAIPTDLQTDQDFADAEQTVKWCGDIEDRLDGAKQHALSQTASIDELFRAIDDIKAEARSKRLELEKLVKARKESIRVEIVTKARSAYQAHEDQCRQDTGGPWIVLLPPDFAGSIKGKRSISSMHDAVDTTLANAKIAASESARKIREALTCLDAEAEGYEHLFADRLSFISKPVDDIRTIARARIVQHKQREADRLEAERERIRKEELDRIERENAAKAAAAATPAPAAAPAPQPAPAPAPMLSPRAPAPAAATQARIKLEEINARIAPLSITADGLASIGFVASGNGRTARTYSAADFRPICDRLIETLYQAAQSKAA